MYYDRNNNIYFSSLLHKSKEHKITVTLKESNNFTMKFNKSATHCLIEYNDTHTYQIYKIAGSNKLKWKLVKEGSFIGGSIAVNNKEDKYSLVEGPGEDNDTTRYVIRTFDDEQRILYEKSDLNREICRLYGGQLVGVQYASTEYKDTSSFQFFSWNGLEDKHKVGNLLGAPNNVVWDPIRQCFGMLYDDFVNIYSVRDDKDKESQRLSLDFTFKVSGSISLFWDFSLVYIATFDDIKCYFLNSQMPHLVLASQKEDNNVTEEDTPLITLSKPLGPLYLFAHINEKLFAVDCEKNIYKFPLNNPYLSCCKMLTVKEAAEALKFVPRIHPKFHKHLSILFATCGFHDEVLKITGLDPWFKLKFCIKNCILTEALPILQRVVKDTLRPFAKSSSILDNSPKTSPPESIPGMPAKPSSQPPALNVPVTTVDGVKGTDFFNPGLKKNLHYGFKEIVDAAEILAEYSRVRGGGGEEREEEEEKEGKKSTKEKRKKKKEEEEDKEVDPSVGEAFLRAVMPLDKKRTYFLLITHFAALGKREELEKLCEEMKKVDDDNLSDMKNNILFCSKCISGMKE